MKTEEKTLPRTKQDIIQLSESILISYQKEAHYPIHSENYYNELLRLLNVLVLTLNTKNVPSLNEDWYYSIEINTTAALLALRHKCEPLGDCELAFDESYTLVEIPVPKMNLEEYGRKNGFQSVTVRQWIRRGKLRDVIKMGNEWVVPAIIDPPTRGYKEETYILNGEFVSFEKYRCMGNHPKSITIKPSRKTALYEITVDGKCMDFSNQNRLFTEEERIEIESQLLGNPKITTKTSTIGSWPSDQEDQRRPIVYTGGMRKYETK